MPLPAPTDTTLANAPPRLAVLLLGPSRTALEALGRQSGVEARLEVITIDEAQAHAALNAALMQVSAPLVSVCDAGLELPADFVATVLAHFDAGRGPAVLRHATAGRAADDTAACCLSLRRLDALRLGGFDEHADYAGPAGAPHELAWRLLNAGVPLRWHDRTLGETRAPAARSTPACTAAEAALADGLLLPRVENRTLREMRLALRTPVTPAERRLCGVADETPAPPAHAPALDWRDIPVFIVNRNRFAALQKLVAWLREAGTRRIVILDNASDYPPLLRWYEALPEGVRAMLMPENHGPYVLWQQKVHEVLDTPYVLTDSDVVPDEHCPRDLVGRLLEVLQRHPDAKKVGPGLRIDDIPDHYGEADTVRKWESQFWEHPVAPGLFRAPIDTTFALYPARSAFSNEACNLRLGAPCLMRHTPWYVDEGALDDEERHYRSHTSAVFSNWSVAKKDSWVKRSERVAAFDARAKVLHLDGGREYIPGWINAGTGPGRFDLAFDPRHARRRPLELPDEVLDGVYLCHVLGEVRDAHVLLEQLWRAAKPGARLVVREPHGTHPDAWAGKPTRRAWAEGSFAQFARSVQPVGSAYAADWVVESIALVQGDDAHTPRDVLAVLRAVKPARLPRGEHPMPQTPPHVVADECVDPNFIAL